MQASVPVILLITTQTWKQVTRLALRLTGYGCRVSALCPSNSELRFLERLDRCQVFGKESPLHSIKTAIVTSGATHVVPGDDLSVWLLQELSERSPQYRALIERSIGPAHSFATVRSRAGLLALASSLGIDVPETALARTPEEARAWSRGRPGPFLIKKDGTFGGGGVAVVNHADELAQQYARLHAGEPLSTEVRHAVLPDSQTLRMPMSWISDPEMSVQAYVEGVAANAMFACDRGKILGSVQARVVAAKGKTGPAVMINLLEDERMARAGQLLASSLELSGFFGLDFILEEPTGRLYLIELNPRCTQMGHISQTGQPDLAARLWAEWSGEPAPVVAAESLCPSICFYPLASEGNAGSSFLEHARLDVCDEDRVLVDRLAMGSAALPARMYRAMHGSLKRLKYRVAPPPPAEIHYFDPSFATGTGATAATVGASGGESAPFQGSFAGRGGQQVSVS